MELLPGLLQGITRVLISYPFDYVRTNLQSRQNQSLYSYLNSNRLSFKDAYRGCTLQLVSVPIDRSIQFLLFEKLAKKYSIITASVASAVLSSVYSVPINFLSTRIISAHAQLTVISLREFIKSKQYYKGYGADLLKSFIGATLYTSIYGSLRVHVHKDYHNYFAFGVASSISSWCVIYPLDTIRVLKQTSQNSYADILKKTPIKKLYTGFSIIIARSVPSAGCGMFVYEKSRELLF